MVQTRTDVINYLIQRFGYKTYLEIGAQDGVNFSQINIPDDSKVSIDPDPASKATFRGTSDEFFLQNKKSFDIIFIDGLHEFSQAYKDIVNSLNWLSPYGIIVMHDCLPTSEGMQKVPRVEKVWTGDVWKAFVSFRNEPDIEMFTVNIDYGVGIITNGSIANPVFSKIKIDNLEFTWENFSKNKNDWMNVIEASDFERNLGFIEHSWNKADYITKGNANEFPPVTVAEHDEGQKFKSESLKECIIKFYLLINYLDQLRFKAKENQEIIKLITNKEFNSQFLNNVLELDLTTIPTDFPRIEQAGSQKDKDIVSVQRDMTRIEKEKFVLSLIARFVSENDYPIKSIRDKMNINLMLVFVIISAD
jgi:hypothetical protein